MPAVDPAHNGPASRLAILYRSHCEALLRFLSRKVGRHEASDLMHETFIRVARAEQGRTVLHNERAFLFQVAANLAVDHNRAQVRQSRLLSPVEIDDLLAVTDEAPGPDRQAQGRLDLQNLAVALRELPPRRAEAFRLSRIEGASHAYIASRLGVSLRTVEAEVRMALDHCADRLRSSRIPD